jgi:hypothetical protein
MIPETLYPDGYEDNSITPQRIQQLMFDILERKWVVARENSYDSFTLIATNKDHSLTLTFPLSAFRDGTLEFFEQQIRAKTERLLSLNK